MRARSSSTASCGPGVERPGHLESSPLGSADPRAAEVDPAAQGHRARDRQQVDVELVVADVGPRGRGVRGEPGEVAGGGDPRDEGRRITASV